jgi:hypothetical protein
MTVYNCWPHASQQTFSTPVTPAATKALATKTKPGKRTKWEEQRSYANLIPADEKEGRLEEVMNR